MAVATIAAFWAVSFLFVITPRADWAYAIAAGLRHRTVLPAVGGLLAGHLAATAVVAAGSPRSSRRPRGCSPRSPSSAPPTLSG